MPLMSVNKHTQRQAQLQVQSQTQLQMVLIQLLARPLRWPRVGAAPKLRAEAKTQRYALYMLSFCAGVACTQLEPGVYLQSKLQIAPGSRLDA